MTKAGYFQIVAYPRRGFDALTYCKVSNCEEALVSWLSKSTPECISACGIRAADNLSTSCARRLFTEALSHGNPRTISWLFRARFVKVLDMRDIVFDFPAEQVQLVIQHGARLHERDYKLALYRLKMCEDALDLDDGPRELAESKRVLDVLREYHCPRPTKQRKLGDYGVHARACTKRSPACEEDYFDWDSTEE
jgi:hypothetical protein